MVYLEEAGGYGRFSGRYLIIKKIGSGGDGTVYLVKHIMTEQLRAAKQIRVGKNGYHELQMMKRLHHPSLPEVIDVLEEKDDVWLILEYVRGEAIQNYAGKKLTPEKFFSFAEQLTEVVGYLHSRAYPILHLDIKPSNILVRKSGRIVLIDFGAAVHAGQTKTSEECRGTPGFAAPEQYQSNARLDKKTDIYGIGAVLFYLLSGSCYLPQENSNSKNSEKGRTGRQIRLKKWREDVRLPFWRRESYRVVANCLEKETKNRYSDCKVLLQELQKVKGRWNWHKKCLPLGGAFALLLLLTCFGGAMWMREEKKDSAESGAEAEVLMDAAKGLGLEAACKKYKEVLQLKPEHTQVLFLVLDQILDDFQFTEEEERNLQELLLMMPGQEEETVQERLEKHSKQAGIFFYRLGLAYWYFYEGSGGRSAGAVWFQRAVDFGEQSTGEVDWLESARIYVEISAYYDKLGKREKEMVYASLWKKLVQLWNSPGLVTEKVQVRTEAAEELLACVVMGAAELCEDEEVDKVLTVLEDFFEKEVQDPGTKEELQVQLEGARMAWRRASTALKKRYD